MISETNSQGKAIPALTNPAAIANVLAGKDFVDLNGNRLIGTAPAKAAETITPGTANRVLTAGQMLTGDQTILGDTDLVAGNIKNGVNIFGVAGNYVGVTPPAISIQLSDTNTSGGTAASKFYALNSGQFNTSAAFLPIYVPINKIVTCKLSWSSNDNASGYNVSAYAYRKLPWNQTSSISTHNDSGYSIKMGQAAVTNAWAAPTQITPFTSGGNFTPVNNTAGSHTFVLPSYNGASLVGLCFVCSSNAYLGFWNAKLEVSFS